MALTVVGSRVICRAIVPRWRHLVVGGGLQAADGWWQRTTTRWLFVVDLGLGRRRRGSRVRRRRRSGRHRRRLNRRTVALGVVALRHGGVVHLGLGRLGRLHAVGRQGGRGSCA